MWVVADDPLWTYYPVDTPPPEWARTFVHEVAVVRSTIDSTVTSGLTSDIVLLHLRPGLVELGYEVERGKKAIDKIRRPVLFGEQGRTRVAYEVDAAHDELGIVVEIEAGRGARGTPSIATSFGRR